MFTVASGVLCLRSCVGRLDIYGNDCRILWLSNAPAQKSISPESHPFMQLGFVDARLERF